MDEPLPIFRAPMRAHNVETPAGAGADFGVARGLVGIGEFVGTTPESLAEAVSALAAANGEKAGRALLRFAGLPAGTCVWTQVADGSYRLGRLRGPWRYDTSAAAHKVGIHHVRRTLWLSSRFGSRDVPAAVARTFARGGRNLQRIHDCEAERRTAALWDEHRGLVL
jgi:hypothetical protein